MILTKDVLTSKALTRSCKTAVGLLARLAKIDRQEAPQYFLGTASGSSGQVVHHYKVELSVPKFLKPATYETSACLNNSNSTFVSGEGQSPSKEDAKSLAALEAIHRLEDVLETKRGRLQLMLEEYTKTQKLINKGSQKGKKKSPTDNNSRIDAAKGAPARLAPSPHQLEAVSWENVPRDDSFPDSFPGTRYRRIDFTPSLVENTRAFQVAKALTLASKKLPTVALQYDVIDYTSQIFANVSGTITTEGLNGCTSATRPEYVDDIMDEETPPVAALEAMYHDFYQSGLLDACRNPKSSFGMAKLFVSLPKPHFVEIRQLLGKVDARKHIDRRRKKPMHLRERQTMTRTASPEQDVHDTIAVDSRIASFRAHQSSNPLPVDDVESKIPHEATVTIVRGGTGSGKTTRYPLMLSLFSPTGSQTKVLVAQPRRLACQTAARRVAFEQGFEIGSEGCPIGYAIRFEPCFSQADSRTVDFATPGVLLRLATDDQLLQDVTHLCIDEVHERNADMDLLLALAKQAQRQRANHETLPPLRLILMSATLNSSHWESYFADSPGQDIRVVDVPGVRRFPIDIVHLGEREFPKQLRAVNELRWCRPGDENYDEALCRATAELAVHRFKELKKGGSILCFLPGMEEIRTVDNFIQDLSSWQRRPTVTYLHSTVSSEDQARVFQPGAKIILSTNIAETSVTIPDVKIVIDAGRERQFSLLDASSDSDTVTVVGSQLVTVNISQASAKQRAGRAGRVSAGTCYRLYTRDELDRDFVPFTTPEMLRMDLSQLVLHALSLYHPTSGHPLSLLLGAPDPPTEARLQQTLHGLADQGLVDLGDEVNPWHLENKDECKAEGVHNRAVSLTPLGQAISTLPASPQISRMLFMGLALRAIEPALTIAALLSVPKVFSPPQSAAPLDDEDMLNSSDIVIRAQAYHNYIEHGYLGRDFASEGKEFEQVKRIREQLGRAMQGFLRRRKGNDNTKGDSGWNTNAKRVAAKAGLICCATPHIAHLVSGRTEFSTRDVAGAARMHPSSVNFLEKRRVHWYMYHELRTTKRPYLHVTSAASPLEIALFSVAGSMDGFPELLGNEFHFVADQWVPVAVAQPDQSNTFMRLRRLLIHDMLQEVAENPTRVLNDADYDHIVLNVLSAIDQQRLSKE